MDKYSRRTSPKTLILSPLSMWHWWIAK